MSRKLTVLTAILLLVALVGCQQEDVVTLTPRSEYTGSSASTMFVKVTASGDWSLALEFPAGDSGWATVDSLSRKGSGDKANVHLYFAHNSSEAPRQVTLVLLPAKGKSVSATVTQSGKGGEAVPGNYGYDVAPMDWLELPAMVSGDGRELLVHDMDGGKYKSSSTSGVRNWSCYWDYAEHLSLWVAYPHNNSLKGSGSRSNAWGWDALLPHDIQPDLTQRSYGGGWTRGHQIPSADRLRSYAANASTFVPTNMTPQQYDFNAGIWAGLEGKVRNYASLADTLYVVTGCLFEDSKTYTGASSGFIVRVPTHYYKALLYRGSSSQATDGFMAAGFLLPHDRTIASANCMSYICTIDELEARTGIDFFPNLAKMLGQAKADAIEGQLVRTFWN
ncbi:MAG: DNA/RNA non-specific endonuclease [Bacteroidales bacterium]|nr:DNA/RNA non-specific endonuclease [Bacteroidales bacterium]